MADSFPTTLYRVQLRTYSGVDLRREYRAKDPAVAREMALAEYDQCVILTVSER